MSIVNDINKVKGNITNIYSRKVAGVYALCLEYCALALRYFRSAQAGNKFWKNVTNQAMDRMFTNPFKTSAYIGWLMAHGVKYGVYLELSNDRRHEAIRLVIQRFAGRFLEAVKDIL